MKKKIISITLIAILLSSTFALSIAYGDISPTLKADIADAIADGMAYVVARQQSDGSWVGISNSYRAAYTGFALIKLQDYAYELGFDSPFDVGYQYSQDVIDGWNWVFAKDPLGNPVNTYKKTITTQDHTAGASGTVDDPDTRANGYGLVFGYDNHRYVYSTGVMLMALEASGTPSRSTGIDFDGNGIPDSFFDVAQDAADWLAFAQGDAGGDEGGWYYSATAAGTPSQVEGGGEIWTDNSNGGFAVLGLAAAEGFGCTIPAWVKTELSEWVDILQDPINSDTYDGGSWYRPITSAHPNGYHWVNAYKTGNLIFEMTFVGDSPTTTRFLNAMDYIERHWHDLGSGTTHTGWGYNTNPAAFLSMYTLMKGFEFSSIDTIDISGLGGSSTHDWFAEFAQVLVNQQNPSDGSWANAYWGDQLLNTMLALLVLEKVSPNIPPTAAFTASPNPVNAGSVVTFTDASYDDDGEVVSWSWDFGDTGTSTEQNPTHTYSAVGSYAVTLTVTDDEGATGTATLTVEVTNAPPVADFTMPPQPYYEGDTVQFTDLSTDSDGVIVAWNWVFSDGGTSTDQNPVHTYIEDGEYIVDLTVTDDDGATDSIYRKVVVLNVAPTVDAGPDQTVRIDSLVDFLGSFTDPGVLDTHTIKWEFGDGTTDSGSLSTSHTYTASGTYVVKLTVTDDDGGVGSDKLIVTVISPKTMKKEAISILESHLGLYDKHIEHDIEQAIWHIEKSLESDLWVDETHLTWQHGNKVFDEEKLAVKELLHIVEWKKAPSDAVDMAYTVIDILVEADEWLANVQYDEASAYASTHKQVDHQLELAEKEFTNAADELLTMKKGHPKYDDAINAYNKAWQHAGLAIQHATK